MLRLKYLLGFIFLAITSAAFSQTFTISDMKELCDADSLEEYLAYHDDGWERSYNGFEYPFAYGYDKQYWYNQYLDLTITTYSKGHRSIVISTLSKEYYDYIRESLPANYMKKRLIGYSDGEYAMQIYSVASEYRPGFYYTITMERR